MLNGSNKQYDQLIKEAAAACQATKAELQSRNEELHQARVEKIDLDEEYEAIRQALAAFEEGKQLLDADEFVSKSDRLRWLEIRRKQQATRIKALEGQARQAGIVQNMTASTQRTRLEALFKEEVEQRRKEIFGRLEEVLR